MAVHDVSERPPGAHTRADPRDIAELKRLRQTQPHLASAIDLQIELVELQRRLQARVPLPRHCLDLPLLSERLRAGRPFLPFDEVPIEWSEFRRMLRQCVDVLERFGMMDTQDCRALHDLTRDARLVPALAAWWYTGGGPETPPPVEGAERFHHPLLLSFRPFLMGCADAVLPNVDTSTWARADCPMCGGDPELAVWPAGQGRHLVCSRCTGLWTFDEGTCPSCGCADASKLKTFLSGTRMYRVDACDACQRYLKGFDGRSTARPFMLALDTIATLPLDAAAIQQGYAS